MGKQQSDDFGPLMAAVQQVLAGQVAGPLPAGLYLVATPIGNLADMSLRALAVLARADVIYCEDKRHSSKLLHHYAISNRLRAYHEHNAAHERERLLELVASGKSVALISDAGTPLISDPGFRLVREARKAGLDVTAIPGASAPVAALVSAGLPSDCFTFAGFLPPKQAARRKRLLQWTTQPTTLVFFESPKRLRASLADMADCLGERQGAVARELTKLHETIVSGPLRELADRFAAQETIRGEIVVLVGPPDPQVLGASEDELAHALTCELQRSSLRDAVQTICARFELPRSKVYNLAVTIKKQMSTGGESGDG